MGRKQTYATKSQLETLVRRMHKTGILYYEALEEFRKQFILVVLREVNWNKSKAARLLGMHRSTLVRKLLSAMPNAVPRMAFAHTSRTETSDDVFGNESAVHLSPDCLKI